MLCSSVYCPSGTISTAGTKSAFRSLKFQRFEHNVPLQNMKFLPLLGIQLKSDEMLDFLEMHDIEVIYDFDRIHENMPDRYCATAKELGVQFLFDDEQVLRTVFVFLTRENGFTPADLTGSDLMMHESKAAVREYAAKHKIPSSEGETLFLGAKSDWIRFDFADHAIHYDFGDGPLKQISLSSTNPAEGKQPSLC